VKICLSLCLVRHTACTTAAQLTKSFPITHMVPAVLHHQTLYTVPQVVFNDLCAEESATSTSRSGVSHCVTVSSAALSEWEHVRSQVARKAVTEADVAAAIKVTLITLLFFSFFSANFLLQFAGVPCSRYICHTARDRRWSQRCFVTSTGHHTLALVHTFAVKIHTILF
jgi:hypothetical protein